MKLGMWIFMLVNNLLIPAVMIGIGCQYAAKPPQKINGLSGYRTKRSMKNQDTWDFAQAYMGKVWRKAGWVLLPLTVLGQALTLFCPTIESMCMWSLAPTTVGVAALIATIFPVERALKKTFDRDGKRLKLFDDKEDLP